MSPLEFLFLRSFIWIALASYVVAWGCRWRDPETCFNAGWPRFWWTLACAAYLAHVVVAFHAFHHWSHNHAVAHTQEQSGFGQGIWVSYLLTAFWVFDVIAIWLVRPARPVWFSRTWHAFLLFMLFNGAVVFARGASLAFGLGCFSVLVVLWARRKKLERPK